MQKIMTTRFGEIDVNQEEILTFTTGLLGFEEAKQFILVPASEDNENPFLFIQSVDQGDLSFLLLDTLSFFPQYDIELNESIQQELEIDLVEDVLVLSIISVKENLADATTNLKAPLILNHKKKKIRQYVLEKDDYAIKQPLFVASQKQQEEVKG